MNRRDFTRLAAFGGSYALAQPALAATASAVPPAATLPGAVPANVQALLNNVAALDIAKTNIDWDGSIRIEALLAWAERGYGKGLAVAKQWFDYQLNHTAKLSDAEFNKTYEGPKGRVFRGGPIPFSVYCGHFGLASPVYRLHQQTKDPRAKAVILSVAEASLLYAPRDQFGYMSHDDVNLRKWTIPDIAYFAVRPMVLAANFVDKAVGDYYLKSAVHMAKACANLFFDPEKKLAKTIYYYDKQATGPTYWCRSQGWVLYGLTFALRGMTKSHPDYPYLTRVFGQMAESLAKVQSPNGAIRVYADDPTSPEEVTGTAMTAACIQEAMDKGWIPGRYNDYVQRSWQFIQKSITPEGKLTNVYTIWAVPADVKAPYKLDDRYRGFATGLVLVAAAQLAK